MSDSITSLFGLKDSDVEICTETNKIIKIILKLANGYANFARLQIFYMIWIRNLSKAHLPVSTSMNTSSVTAGTKNLQLLSEN